MQKPVECLSKLIYYTNAVQKTLQTALKHLLCARIMFDSPNVGHDAIDITCVFTDI